MKKITQIQLALLILIAGFSSCQITTEKTPDFEALIQNPPESAKPWVFWYWMKAAVSKEGITADLEAMAEAGIGGAYLMPIMGKQDPPMLEPAVEQLTPLWWEMVEHAFNEANRLGLQIAMHASDGFALSGGPWITPELSMQKVVWSMQTVEGGRTLMDTLTQPETNENYYRDIATFAFPVSADMICSSFTEEVTVSTSVKGADASFLNKPDNKEKFRSKEPCWIQYEFAAPFTCRSIHIRTRGNNMQSNRLGVEVSNDGITFKKVAKLQPPRHGWQDTDADFTHAIESITAKYFRFTYSNKNTEPGAEDLDAGKWKQSLKIAGIELSGMPRINQYEGKNGSVWRVAPDTKAIPDELCIDPKKLVNLTEKMAADGTLNWDVPEGNWMVMRMGHTSTGHTNYTGGAALGLEVDKFNPAAVALQYKSWFGEAVKHAGPELTKKVLSTFHVDSWECGSQNWSTIFREVFEDKRDYDIVQFLPVFAGIPIGSIDRAEMMLYDVRQTIAELMIEHFYQVYADLAHLDGMKFSAEAVAPTMLSDGMRHYDLVDLPMGEFWFRSPTHDKPNDMADAISGAHVYGKNIIQAECFTSLKIYWDEHPGMLKSLADRNYALGVNKMVYHVFTQNPWLDRKPGMTLNGVGLYFQRDQTWWKPGREWVSYAQRCQALLQQGTPVADIAVFTGEELPRRSVLPDRLVSVLPGIMGQEREEKEKIRQSNEGQPTAEMPVGVTHSANVFKAENWIDPLNGYAYDSFNPDALMRLATVEDGKIVLPGGAAYSMLLIPGKSKLNPNGKISQPVAERLMEFMLQGATVMIEDPETLELFNGVNSSSLYGMFGKILAGTDEKIKDKDGNICTQWLIGDGRLISAPCKWNSFSPIGIEKDFMAFENRVQTENIAWNHRSGDDFDIYFISNQKNEPCNLELSFRIEGMMPELYNPVMKTIRDAGTYQQKDGRTLVPVTLEANGSLFVIFRKGATSTSATNSENWRKWQSVSTINNEWQVKFDTDNWGPKEPQTFTELTDWSKSDNEAIKFYSGTTTYTTTFKADTTQKELWLDLGEVANIAEVFINDTRCGIVWTKPYRLNITDAITQDENKLRIEVTNTWANRIIGDHELPDEQRHTWTTVPWHLEGKPLLKAGLLGPVQIGVWE